MSLKTRLDSREDAQRELYEIAVDARVWEWRLRDAATKLLHLNAEAAVELWRGSYGMHDLCAILRDRFGVRTMAETQEAQEKERESV